MTSPFETPPTDNAVINGTDPAAATITRVFVDLGSSVSAGGSDWIKGLPNSARTFADGAGTTDSLQGVPVETTMAFTDDAGGADVTAVSAEFSMPTPDMFVEALDLVAVIATVTLIAPEDQAVVPSATPTFVASVTTDDDYAVLQFEYDTDPYFSAGQTLVADVAAGLDNAVTSATVTIPLADESVYYWHARIISGVGQGPWSDTRTLAVNTPDGGAVGPGSWVVAATVEPIPHLWMIDPGSGQAAGEPATLVGTGFGTNPTVLVGDTVAADVTVTDYPATGDPALIDPETGAVTVYHQRITFTIPDLGEDSAGAAITVQRG